MEKCVNEIRKKDIEQLFESIYKGYLYTCECKEKKTKPLSEEEWLKQMHLYQDHISSIYVENARLIREIYAPMSAHIMELSPSLCEIIYDYTYEMYYSDKENPSTLQSMATLIIPHFESSGDIEKLVFCYTCLGYSYLELSRTGDEEAAKQAVYWYRKVTSCKRYIREFKNDRTRTLIIAAYVNLILACFDLEYFSFEEEIALWEEFHSYYEEYQLKDYEEEIPRIRQLYDFLVTRFNASIYFHYHWYTKLGGKKDPEKEELYWKMTNQELSVIREDVDHPLHNSAEMYCDYERALLYRGLQNPTDTWKKMYQFTMKYIYDKGVLSSSLADPVGSISNPIMIMTQLLPECDFSDEQKAAICEHFCDMYMDFGRKYWENSYTVNGAMKEYFFGTPLLGMLKEPKHKQARMMELVISRQFATYLHSLMVSKLAVLLLEATLRRHPEYLIGLLDTTSEEEVLQKTEDLKALTEKAALLHDVGKNALIDIITTEYRAISDYEFQLIKNHPKFGADYLKLDPYFADVVDVALGHHKFYDGTGGYPSDFSNVESKSKPLIDLITICDCMDAATDNIGRNYHKAKTYDELLGEFQQGAGTRYHPGYVEILTSDETVRTEMTQLITEGRLHIGYQTTCKFMNDRES